MTENASPARTLAIDLTTRVRAVTVKGLESSPARPALVAVTV